MNTQSIVVMGAGAVGCYFGGMLGRAGHRVTLIGRPDHVRAIESNGLLMDCLNFKEHVKVRATTELDVIATADILLFCVKSPDTTAAIQMMQKYLKPHTVIVSLQNGVDNCDRIRELVPNPVIPAVVYVAAAMLGPGELKHHGRGELVIGNWEKIPGGPDQNEMLLDTIADLLKNAAVPCMISPDIKTELWTKFLVNCSYNAISAIGQIQYGKMAQVVAVRSLIDELANEVLNIAKLEGIEITNEQARFANEQIVKTMATQRSSTAQDIARKKSTEIEFLNGLIVRKGKQYGIPTPANLSVYALVKMIEQFNA